MRRTLFVLAPGLSGVSSSLWDCTKHRLVIWWLATNRRVSLTYQSGVALQLSCSVPCAGKANERGLIHLNGLVSIHLGMPVVSQFMRYRSINHCPH